jgi:hypothetical protein
VKFDSFTIFFFRKIEVGVSPWYTIELSRRYFRETESWYRMLSLVYMEMVWEFVTRNCGRRWHAPKLVSLIFLKSSGRL